ncbi:MAG: cyclodeaminase/cyclohydrolase family protein [Thermoleophilia bacterium]|nr:cyclodeaminase/cyclohydrolase family protein [Thermoleophilia bacterium]MDH5332379.1 cyclodeaminase/cyclohydrolase family protein [Thermoleophilia bacterium]
MTRPSTAGTAVPSEQQTLAALLDALEAPAPSPCGGSAAAVGAAMGAALVALVARSSPTWEEAGGVAAQASALRARLTELADEDVRAFGAALEAMAVARGSGGARDHLVGVALEHAAEVPLAIAAAAADVAELAALAATEGKASVRADAVAGALLAEAAAVAAAHLVEVNLAMLPDDERVLVAAAHVEAAGRARERALGGGS